MLLTLVYFFKQDCQAMQHNQNMESMGRKDPVGFLGLWFQCGMTGDAGIPAVCEVRNCSIHVPVVCKEMGLVKGSLSLA
ncbi:hypothetical protein QQF64_033660 [Cirrhinus molitorella]|uniref:Uncharacterized protein n=1 Tax=Cirrhinus molitorella TaxID=172907 RepID=A0ABR3MUM8_9TELE